MLGLIHNEFIKLRYRKKFLLTVIIFAALCALFAFAYVKITQLQNPDTQIEMLKKAASTLETEKKNEKDDKKKAQLDQSLSQINDQIKQLELSKSVDSSDWKTALKANIASLKEQRDSASDITADSSIESYNKQIILYQYLIDHNIQLQKATDISAFTYITQLFELIGAIFIPIIIAILSADIVSGEYTPPTMKVLLTRPASRKKFLFSKYLSAILASLAVILSIELLSYLVMGIIFGFGNSSYPVVVGTTYRKALVDLGVGTSSVIPVVGSSFIIPAWQYTILLFLFQIVYIASCASLFFLFSTILRSSTLSMTLSILLTIVIAVLSQIPYLQKIKPFMFTVYGSSVNVISGMLPAASTGVTYSTPLFALLFLIISGGICYAISHFVFTKKDIMI